MKRNRSIFILILSFLIMFQANAFADAKAMKGELISIDPVSYSFQIASGETVEEKEKGAHVVVVKDTLFNGIASLTDLRQGDEVAVEAELNKDTNIWEARSVSLVKVKIRDTAP